TNTNNNNNSVTNNNTSTSIISTTTNIRQTINIYELRAIYGTISSQSDQDIKGTNTSLTSNTNTRTNTGQFLLSIHAIAQSTTQLGKIA
ncbi:unnamed protein product, partial [Adineta steineri]